MALLDQVHSEAERTLWSRWMASYRAAGIAQYVIDGAGPGYFDAPVRILFVLKDPNRWEGVAMQAQLSMAPTRMWKAVARWGYIASEVFGSDSPRPPLVARVTAPLSLASLAVINLKKVTGVEACDDDTLNYWAHHDRELLVEQVQLLRPDLIVGCGTTVPLLWLLGRNPTAPATASAPYRAQAVDSWVLPWRHPARSKHSDDESLRAQLTTIRRT